VALLVGLQADSAVLWEVFSHVAKPLVTLRLAGSRTDGKAVYNFHESVLDALRPVLREGVRSVVLVAPAKVAYASDFLDHARRHHGYLFQSNAPSRVAFAELVGSAGEPHEVADLVKSRGFRRLIEETTSDEADFIVDALEKRLGLVGGGSGVLFSLEEIEDAVYGREGKAESGSEFLVLTDRYLAESHNKARVQRLLQIAQNKKVKTRIVSAETPAGKRISQFGGVVFFTMPTK
jgi:stalled ribosome rescue protein Dom34